MPGRLGGGYLFHANAGGGTEIWRAASWLGKLEPLARRSEVVTDIVPGFDRLYLRLATGNRVIALDPATGAQMALGPLPLSASYGMLAFADGWRGVVDTDLRGPLATFDAGSTWRSVGVFEKPLAVGVVAGNLAVMVQGGRYIVDARGGVTRRSDDAHDTSPGEPPSAEVQRPGPLGKHPLRAAVEDGWPDSPTTAIVARGGALGRVSLGDGAVTALVEDAYPEHRSTCHAVRLGLHGVGFVCGERDGPTTVYELAPPLGMKPVMRFDRPRFVAASGNGAIVVRGRCAEEAPAEPSAAPGKRPEEADARWYCVRSPAGKQREVRIKGFDLGVERVVGLADGRVAVLVPPRGGSPGMISIIAGAVPVNVPLVLPEEPKTAARELKHGMWLEGFEERSPRACSAAGSRRRRAPRGRARSGSDEPGQGRGGSARIRSAIAGGVIVGGRFAGVGHRGRARGGDDADGGMTWIPFPIRLPATRRRAQRRPALCEPRRRRAPGLRSAWAGASPRGCRRHEGRREPGGALRAAPRSPRRSPSAAPSPRWPRRPRPTKRRVPPPPLRPPTAPPLASRRGASFPARRSRAEPGWLPFPQPAPTAARRRRDRGSTTAPPSTSCSSAPMPGGGRARTGRAPAAGSSASRRPRFDAGADCVDRARSPRLALARRGRRARRPGRGGRHLRQRELGPALRSIPRAAAPW